MAILQGYFCKQILTLKTETKIYILTAPRLAIKASKKHTTIKQVSLFTSEKMQIQQPSIFAYPNKFLSYQS